MSDEIDFQPEAEAEIDFVPEEASAPAGDGIDFEPEAAAAPAPKTTRTPLERATRKAQLLLETADARQEGKRLDRNLAVVDAGERVAYATSQANPFNVLKLPWLASQALGTVPADQPFPQPRIPAATPNPDAGMAGEIGAGVFNAGADLANFLLTPEGMGAMAAGGGPAVAARALGTGFATQMASQVPEAAAEFGRATVEEPLHEQIRTGAGLGASIGFPAAIVGGARHRPVTLEDLRRVAPEVRGRPVEGKIDFVPEDGTKPAVSETKAPPSEPFAPPGETVAPVAAPEAGSVPGGAAVMASPAAPNKLALQASLDAATDARTRLPQVLDSYANLIEMGEGGDVPLRTGRIAQKAEGIFKVSPRVVRLRTYGDLPVATHEVFHALEKPLASATGTDFGSVPPAARAELLRLGQALYPTQPGNGWLSEGWAEFGRHYLTRDDAATVAPALHRWFETEVAARPGLQQGLAEARAQTDIWRGQGAEARVDAQQVASPGTLKRLAADTRENAGDFKRQFVEAFEPLRELSARAAEIRGRELLPSEDPFLIASLKRGSAGSLVDVMVRDGMIDPWGQPTGGKSLVDAIGPAINQPREFTRYLYARRAVERWGKGKNPGISLEDAEFIRRKYDSPAFQVAANNVYEWWGGVLNYLEQANPAMKPAVDRIRAESQDYVPLARDFDPVTLKRGTAGQGGNPLQRMRGSGRPIKDIWETTLKNTQAILEQAHQAMTLRAVADLAKLPEIGHLLEEVPRERVMERVNFDQLREQLDALGVDTAKVPPNELLNFYTAAKDPRGRDPIVAIPDGSGAVKWYQVQPALYDALQGMESRQVTGAANLLLMAPKRMFTLGTTGLRSSFALITNPIRDLPSWLLQTQSRGNPARLMGDWLAGMKDALALAVGRPTEAAKQFERLGVGGGQFFGGDIAHTQRAARGLFHGKVFKIVRSPIEAARELIGFSEAGPRIAEMRALGRELGWKPGQAMTRDQAIRLGVAAKRATVDFSAKGNRMDAPGADNTFLQSIPFFNAAIQGTRSFARAIKERPARAIMMGLATVTVPTLVNWWNNKDKEWYKALPWRERYLYTNIDLGNGTVLQIPRPQEWGAAFAVAPEALADWWHTQDPEGAVEGLSFIADLVNPLDLPVLMKTGAEQLANKSFFFDRPIVPRGKLDLPAREQSNRYTSRPARWIGETINFSPARIDHIIRSTGGGVAMDLANLGTPKSAREPEAADTFLAGRLFRRGGDISANSRPLQDFYDQYSEWAARSRSKAKPLTEKERLWWKDLAELHDDIRTATALADNMKALRPRQEVYRRISADAARLLREGKAKGLVK